MEAVKAPAGKNEMPMGIGQCCQAALKCSGSLLLGFREELLAGGHAIGWPQIKLYNLGRAMAHALTQIIARNAQLLATVIDPAQDDMGMRKARVVVIGRDPLKLAAKIKFHLPEQATGQVPQARIFPTMFNRHHDPELVGIGTGAFEKAAAVVVATFWASLA